MTTLMILFYCVLLYWNFELEASNDNQLKHYDRDFHYEGKTVVKPSYFNNGDSL